VVKFWVSHPLGATRFTNEGEIGMEKHTLGLLTHARSLDMEARKYSKIGQI